MTDIQLTPEIMRNTSKTLEGGKNEIDALLHKLQHEVNVLLGDNFKTQKASPAFGEGYTQLDTSMHKAVDGIVKMAQALNQMAQSAEDWDAQHAGH